MQHSIDESLSEVIEALTASKMPSEKVYLVGGMVRDILLDLPIHDLDVVYSGDVKIFSKKVADRLEAAFFMLNEKYQTARIINTKEKNSWQYLDVVLMQGHTILEDLEKRDFTINAMALDLESIQQLIDPLGGARDLHNRIIVACSKDCFRNDPLRVMRAIRFSLLLGCQIDKSTQGYLKEAVPSLDSVSVERKRDELMRLLALNNPSQAIHLMLHTGILKIILAEIKEIISSQSFELNDFNRWELTFRTIKKAEFLEKLFFDQQANGEACDIQSAQLIIALSHFRDYLKHYFDVPLNAERNLKSLFYLTLLYCQYDFDSSCVNQSKNQKKYMDAFALPFKNLSLSKKEINLASKTLRYKKRVHEMAAQKDVISSRDVFYFFQETGEAGIFICLMTIVEDLARIQLSVSFLDFEKELNFIKTIFQGYFEKYEQCVAPVQYLDGYDLAEILSEKDHRRIGYWKQKLSAETADQTINSYEDAIKFMSANYSKNNGNRTSNLE